MTDKTRTEIARFARLKADAARVAGHELYRTFGQYCLGSAHFASLDEVEAHLSTLKPPGPKTTIVPAASQRPMRTILARKECS